MTDDDLAAELAGRRALIVHFSHEAAMREGVTFPGDLVDVCVEKEPWALSCSVLTPGHQMNVVGTVGVVLEPRSASNVLRVHHSDGGAFSDGPKDFSLGKPLSQASFDASIDKVEPGDYNEWRVRGARPVAIFVLDPRQITVKMRGTIPEPFGRTAVTIPIEIGLAQVRGLFHGLPIVTIGPDGPQTLLP